jgi:alkylation response protein AidB-like acyl-CoA dehydrogenase
VPTAAVKRRVNAWRCCAPITGTELSARDGSRLRLNLTEAAIDCRAALDRMLDLHGASGFQTSSPLQRFWRDVSVAGRHPHLNPYLAIEAYGSALV